jgi:hypothetical protein
VHAKISFNTLYIGSILGSERKKKKREIEPPSLMGLVAEESLIAQRLGKLGRKKSAA